MRVFLLLAATFALCACAQTPTAQNSERAPTEGELILGKKIYEQSCGACHNTGVAKAPKAKNKEDWRSRMKQGFDVLVSHAIKGENAMPPKGGNLSLRDEEISAAVRYMTTFSDFAWSDKIQLEEIDIKTTQVPKHLVDKAVNYAVLEWSGSGVGDVNGNLFAAKLLKARGPQLEAPAYLLIVEVSGGGLGSGKHLDRLVVSESCSGVCWPDIIDKWIDEPWAVRCGVGNGQSKINVDDCEVVPVK